MLKAIIFDVDGTLVDSVDAHAQAWVETLADFGCPVDFAAVRHQIGKGGDQLMKEFLSDEQIERDGKEIEAQRKAHFAKHYLPDVKGFPRVRKLFERLLEDDRQIALASSAAGDELETYKEKADIADLVDAETSKDDADQSKPEPDIFQAALERLEDVEPAEVFVIGDAPWDAIAANRAGIRTIGLLCGGFPEVELLQAGCVAIYRDAADLLEQYDDSPLAEPKL